ncbi:hypothetical protein M427DRAFT_155480 [Gonapodya prolifera JEL478]|uniref:Uncharacterized protein n=1 Tax=Gonapodya prolifera (strain JEL478) TaxID=1344416 RepID=A0A139AFG7_GONPJ|nr:hypothetical protein M427DRAFT_155480 [Gonapodya prolifera JEL478]|eukprot:KXS15314.1 hypothetical protein M427DRAFT_155480 [Gonapodya prolifera JEL478]
MTNPPPKIPYAASKCSAWAAAELPPTSFDHLSDFLTWQIHQYRDKVTYPLPKTNEEFSALWLAAKELEKMVNSPRGSTLARTWAAKQQDGEPKRFSFFKDLLAFIWDAALDERIPESLEDAGLSIRSLVHLLSNALLLNVTVFRSGRFANIDLYHLLAVDHDEVGKERTLCLLAYLFYVYAANPSDLDTRVITFERVSYPETSLDDSFAPPAPLPSPSSISISAASMESLHADAFFDFANKRVHIHRIIASCTQEEVLFTACPESGGLVRGVRRFCSYTGYMDTFQFVDVDPAERHPDPFTILIADACYSEHCCGVFGGDKAHKFLQQIVAFGRLMSEMGGREQEQGIEFPLVMHYSELNKKGVSCAQLEAWIVEYGEAGKGGKGKKRESFEKFIDEKLSGGESSESASG